MQRAQLRRQLAGFGRLRKMRVGAALETPDARADVAVRGQHHDADARALAQQACERKPALALDVDDDEIAARRGERLLERGHVGESRGAEVRAREPEHEPLARGSIIADDIDRRTCVGERALVAAWRGLELGSHRSVLIWPAGLNPRPVASEA